MTKYIKLLFCLCISVQCLAQFGNETPDGLITYRSRTTTVTQPIPTTAWVGNRLALKLDLLSFNNYLSTQNGLNNSFQTQLNTTSANLLGHANNILNPHGVTKAQVGLPLVPNVDATQRANHTGTQPASTIDGLKPVATSGVYADLTGKPTNVSVFANDASYATIFQMGTKADTAKVSDISRVLLPQVNSIAALQTRTELYIYYDGSTWERIPTGALSTTIGQGYMSTAPNGLYCYKRRVANNVFAPEIFGAKGDNSTNDLAALNRCLAYIEAIGGGTLQGPVNTTYAYGGTNGYLIAGSNTTISGAYFRSLPNTSNNMLRTRAGVSGTGRTSFLTIRNTTFDRGVNGGVGNENHTLFFRACDNVTLSYVTFYTPANISKYAASFANYTNVVAEHIRGKTGSDCLHFTGPGKNAFVHDVIGEFGDDIVGVTTQDYDLLNDSKGTIDGFYVDGVVGLNNTRALTFGVVSDTLRNVIVRNVIQRAVGIPAVTTGDGAYTTGRIDDLAIEDAVGSIQIRHQNIGKVHIARATAKGNVVLAARDSRDPGLGGGNVYGTCHIEQLFVSDIASLTGAADNLVVVDTDATVDNLIINSPRVTERGVLGMSALSSRIRQLAINNARLTLRVPMAGLYGRVDQMTLNNVVTNTVVTTVPVINAPGSTTVGTINVRNSDFTGLDYSTAALVEGPGSVSVINVDGSTCNTMKRLFESTAGTSVTTTLNLSNLTLNGMNRIVQSNANVRVNYTNLTLNGTQNNPFYVFGGASLIIKGSGWTGWNNSAVVRSGSEVINAVTLDLPIDPAIVATTAGNSFVATANAVNVPTGPVVADGTSWISPATQPRVLATVSGISGTTTGVTTIYTVPSTRLAVITEIVIRANVSTAITAPATVEVGQDNSTNDQFASQTLTGLTFQEGTYTLTPIAARRWINSGKPLKLNITGPAQGTTQTWSVDVKGYLR
ncbi:hypothetical protein ACAW74_25775 [Fibrella sp. WM1]|uniref:hypothetical protein n=1 Tax=Fibrella musci TaxID=3242485 RepID=UPI00351FB2F0